MSPHQMVCHLIDALRMATGEKRVSDDTTTLRRTLVKWIVLYAPLKWPAGILTRPEIDQEQGGTRPVNFDVDVAELEALVGSFSRNPKFIPVHPIFGSMSRANWMRWAYLHIDHHLRQFGV
jgi:hypothetical protein